MVNRSRYLPGAGRHSLLLLGLLTALLLLSLASPAAAQSFNRSLPLYVLDGSNNLLRTVDPLTGDTLTVVNIIDADGNVDFVVARGLAIHPITGELFAILAFDDGGFNFVLATIDPSTDPAQATIIGPVVLGADTLQIVDLTFAPDGTLYGVNDAFSTPPSELVTINLATAASVVSLDEFGADQRGNAIAFNPEDNLLYHATFDDFNNQPFMQSLNPTAADVEASKTVIPLQGRFEIPRAMDYFGNNTLLLFDTIRNLSLVKASGQVRFLSAVVVGNAGGIAFAGLAPACPPFQRLYGAANDGPDGPSLFYTLDPDTADATLIGPIGFERVGAMDFLSDGTLIAIGETQDGSSTGTTLEINPCTGLGTAIGATGAAAFGDVSADSADNVFGTLNSATSQATVNTATGAASAVTAFDPVTADGGGLAFDLTDTLLLVTECNPAVLSTVNPADATRTDLFALANDLAVEECARVNAMDFNPFSGLLFGSLVDGGPGFVTARRNFLVTIDTAFFDVVTVGQTQEGLDAIAFNSVLADLEITKVAVPDTVDTGVDVTFTLTITNNGPSNATNVVVEDTLPAGFVTDTVTPSQGSCLGANPITCNLAALNDAASATIVIVGAFSAVGALDNTATVTADQADPDPANNTDSATVTVGDLADLEITKVAVPARAVAGEQVTFTLTITNLGPGDATNVIVLDDFTGSNDFVLESATPSQGACMDFLTCELGDIANGNSATVDIVVTTNVTGSLPNTATVSADQTDPVPANNSSTVTVTPSLADLEITKVADPLNAAAGDEVTFTITVTNLGPDTATNVVVQDVVSDDFFLDTVTPSQGACMDFFSCQLGNLASGNFATIEVVLTTNLTGTLANTATVASDQNDPDPDNNSSTATIMPSVADLAITKVIAPGQVFVGDEVTFTLTVTNNGPDDATNVVVTDVLSDDFAFDSATPSQGICMDFLTCQLGSLADGASATVVVVLSTNVAGLLTNTASVAAAQDDPAPGNNSASANVTAEEPPLFTLSVNPSGGSVLDRQPIVFSVTVATTQGTVGAVVLSCVNVTGSPGITCAFDPGSVTPGTGTATSTLTVTPGALAALSPEPTGPIYAALWLALPALALLGVSAFGGGRRRLAYAFGMSLLLLALLLPLAGCNQGEQFFSVSFQVRGTMGTTEVTSQVITVTVLPQ